MVWTTDIACTVSYASIVGTNRNRIERRLRREGWYLARHGSGHNIYRHPLIQEMVNPAPSPHHQGHTWRSEVTVHAATMFPPTTTGILTLATHLFSILVLFFPAHYLSKRKKRNSTPA